MGSFPRRTPGGRYIKLYIAIFKDTDFSESDFFKNRVLQGLNLSIYAEFHAEFESGNDLLISLEKTALISKILFFNFPFFQCVFGPGPHEAPLAPIFIFLIIVLPPGGAE